MIELGVVTAAPDSPIGVEPEIIGATTSAIAEDSVTGATTQVTEPSAGLQTIEFTPVSGCDGGSSSDCFDRVQFGRRAVATAHASALLRTIERGVSGVVAADELSVGTEELGDSVVYDGAIICAVDSSIAEGFEG